MRADARPLAWPWVAVGTVSALALSAGLLVLAAREGGSDWFFYLSDSAFPLVWILTGLAAWRLRPRSSSGRLMVLLGCALFLNAPWGWQLPTDLPLREVFTTLGATGYWFALTLAAHLLVTYPTGETETAAERALLRTAHLSAALVTLAQLLLMTVDEARCSDRCHVSPIAVVDDRGIFVAAMRGAHVWFAVLAVAVLVLMVLRFRRAGPRWRRQRTALLVACVTVVVGTGTQFVLTAAIGSVAASPVLFYGPVWLVVIAVPSAFLVGLLRDRVSYGSVADLVARLDQVRPDDLQAALATTLQDPRLRILFPVGSEGDYVDSDGQWVNLPDDPSLAVTPLGDGSAPVAVLLHDRTLSENPKLLAGAGGAARLALDNARLQAEVKAQLAEVRASRARIVAAADEERRRLERDLHDGAQQRLLGIGMSLQMLRQTSRGAEPVGLAELEVEVRSAIAELRDLAQGIRPAVLTDEGLVAAVGLLARRCPVPVSVDADVSPRPPADIEATAYYVVSEALQNVAKHARASAAVVTLRRDNDWLEVLVSDDGVGGASLESGSGLRGLRDRALAVDGNLRVTCPEGGGTALEARLPCG